MISSVYNYYLSQYGNTKTTSKNDTHKKSELKNISNNIMQLNSKAPFFKVDLSADTQKFAIDVKENALALSNVLSELNDSGESGLKKIAYSSDTDVLDAAFIGNSANSYPDIDIEVKNLAAPQINTGAYLAPNGKSLSQGQYTFDVDISNVTYEFQFAVNQRDTNSDVQNKLARLINNSNIGLNAGVVTDSMGNTALAIASNSTGTIDNSDTIFDIEDSDDPDSSGSVEILGLNQTTQYPQDATFTINGDERTSGSNSFILGKAYDITLKSVSDEPVTLGLKADSESMLDNIKSIVHGYNSLIDLAKNDSVPKSSTSKLYTDFSNIVKAHNALLSKNGLSLSDDGTIEIDDNALKSASDSTSIKDVLADLKTFKNELQAKTENIVLDPMAYANKLMVSYKNPNLTINNPYTSSAYAGMMFNGYI